MILQLKKDIHNSYSMLRFLALTKYKIPFTKQKKLRMIITDLNLKHAGP